MEERYLALIRKLHRAIETKGTNRNCTHRIRIVLAEQDKKSAWLAEQLGYNKSTVSRWCSNSMQPSVESLFKIAAILNVDVRELLVSTAEKE